MGSKSDVETDGGTAVDLPQDELYTVVHTAVKDAMLDVIATVLLLGLGLLFVAGGIQAVFQGSASVEYVVAGVTLGIGLVLIAAAFDLVPSVHRRFLN